MSMEVIKIMVATPILEISEAETTDMHKEESTMSVTEEMVKRSVQSKEHSRCETLYVVNMQCPSKL